MQKTLIIYNIWEVGKHISTCIIKPKSDFIVSHAREQGSPTPKQQLADLLCYNLIKFNSPTDKQTGVSEQSALRRRKVI